VTILEKLTRLRSEREILENFGIEQFDRLGLGQSGKTVPALTKVINHPRLMVLGKPGAGKTTFLKYLAIQCISGKFLSDKVPFFVTLKDFAEAAKMPSLMKYMAGLSPKVLTDKTVEKLLEEGRAFVLLDGLDEVREEDTKRVTREIRETADRFGASQLLITCRIAAKEYTFERFIEVEISDFDTKQIEVFVENWFCAKNDLFKAKKFMERLKQHKPIRELATSPLLLTLLCLVFGEEGDFPMNRSDLYEEGVRILLKKWDSKRNIERIDLYKKLDVQRREDLLSSLALKSFQEKEYFIKKRRIEGYIADFIGNLRGIDLDPDSLRMDSEIVLKSIQSQHGLLVERARGIYSFSHLTFQEYFTAREIVNTNNINLLVQQIVNPRWQEVFLLTTGMMRNADELILSMKRRTDLLLQGDSNLEDFLNWASKKYISKTNRYPAVSIRAFYHVISYTYDSKNTYNNSARERASDIIRIYKDQVAHALGKDYTSTGNSELDLDLNLSRIHNCALESNFKVGLNISKSITDELIVRFKKLLKSVKYSELENHLKNLFDQLTHITDQNHEKWWEINGKQWREDLHSIMKADRDIGYDWQFTDPQQQLLKKYYDANHLIIECLNSDCYVSRHVRESIEETLLLPIEELRMKNVELRE
jgi:predicted NACHT family NTPase